ncbi:hypothetical protein [Thauera linaloolentis]|uniref:hypothetical protein n=1 Tax=Thauera linaloolentis TaxID=76112 RepID=UPI000B1B2FB0|nr:hypothetical protein [Thauera linaloolentis]MCM8567453.1 hypothetical protein [Thauera linaloolentis]
MSQRKKILEASVSGAYSFFVKQVFDLDDQNGACGGSIVVHRSIKPEFLHHCGAGHEAGAHAPGFFVRVRFVC